MAKDETPVLDRVAFDDFARLFDRDELRDVVDQWHADSITALEAIAAAHARDDRARIGDLAHRVAGGGLAIGATALAQAAERLRACAESGGAVGDADMAPVRDAVAATFAALCAASGGSG